LEEVDFFAGGVFSWRRSIFLEKVFLFGGSVFLWRSVALMGLRTCMLSACLLLLYGSDIVGTGTNTHRQRERERERERLKQSSIGSGADQSQ